MSSPLARRTWSFRRFLDRIRRGPLAGSDALKTPIRNRIHRHAQSAMVVTAQRDEAERLQRSFAGGADRDKHFGHGPDRPAAELEGKLDQVAPAQRAGKPQ